MNKCILPLILTALIFSTACAADRSKDLGAQAANSGHLADAYRLWLPLAQKGDTEVQESIALLLVSDQDMGLKISKTEREKLALKWIIRSAKGGRQSARKWLADSFKHGWLGLNKNENASICWSDAANSKSTRLALECELFIPKGTKQ
jgi:hypothetical protein